MEPCKALYYRRLVYCDPLDVLVIELSLSLYVKEIMVLKSRDKESIIDNHVPRL